MNRIFFGVDRGIKQQEAHGPYGSPEKTIQINKHMIIS